MHEFEVLTFRKGHVDFFKAKEGQEGLAEAYANHLDSLGEIAQAGTHMIDGNIIFFSGFWEKAPGVWEVVIIPSVHLVKHKKAVIKNIRVWLQYIREHFHARRIQTYGLPENPVMDRWLRCLGFTFEATLKCYDVEGDATLWRMIWPDY